MFRIPLLRLVATAGIAIGCGLAAPRSAAAAEDQRLSVTVADFSYHDTSGEPSDQTAAHQRRLQAFMTALRADIDSDQRFHLVPSTSGAGATLDEQLQAAAQAGAKILLVGGVHKLSTLVQWARAAAIDVASHRVLVEKLFTFRGDDDQAWQRAEAFMSQEMRAALIAAPPSLQVAAPARLKLAVFDFELEDTSAGAATPGETASDRTGLTDTTSAVRRLLAQAGGYQLIDVRAAREAAARDHGLHDCGGCDAKIAAGLGADQSLVGVIRRVSRMEYTVRFAMRDTKTGAVVADGDSGLRMGANYSWSRGAVQLVRDRLIARGAH
ncbi:MAG: DUF2380 domain-containing protein [Gemmatimonas sp.]